MKILFSLFIFFIILFFYIHILFQLKTSNDLEIYELNLSSKDKFEEVLNIRQPFVFSVEDETIFNITMNDISNNYSSFDLKIKNIEDEDNILLPFTLNKAMELFKQDKKNIYHTEKNNDFLLETGLHTHYLYNDEYFRPPLLCNSKYDLLFGSNNSYTQLRYEVSYRNYILVNEGKIRVKLTPPKNNKYLFQKRDYENFEFYSPINPWNIDSKYKPDIDKVSFLDIELHSKQCLFIPPYWWYSIQFQEESNVSFLKYYTIMNNITILPILLMYYLQIYNIKFNILKKKLK
jgi:hypothetical protein